MPNSGNAPLASDITVNPLPPDGHDAQGNPGIRFGLGGYDAADKTATDSLLTYKVTAVDPSGKPLPVLSDVHQQSNLAIAGTPQPGDSPFGNVVLTASAPGIPNVAQLSNSVTATSSIVSDAKTLASLVPPQSTLSLTSDMLLHSTPDANTTVSAIDQSFAAPAQIVPAPVPEPGSMAIMGFGFLGFLALVQNRQRRIA